MAARSAAGGRASDEGPSLPRPQKPSDRFPASRLFKPPALGAALNRSLAPPLLHHPFCEID